MKKVKHRKKLISSAIIVGLSTPMIASAETNPFAANDLKQGYQLAEAGSSAGSGKNPTGVDMAGNVVELEAGFRFGGDDMGTYADGKIGTGAKDPSVCGTFSSAKCSMGHLKDK